MHRRQCKVAGAGYSQCASASELFGPMTRMSCACAGGLTAAGSLLARELFHRVECEGQCLAEASRALGISTSDSSYLLAGMRRDAAMELVVALVSATAAGTPRSPQEARRDPGVDQPIHLKGKAQ